MKKEDIEFLNSQKFELAMIKQETKHETKIFTKKTWANHRHFPSYDITIWHTPSGYRYKIGWGDVEIGGATIQQTYLLALCKQHSNIRLAIENITAVDKVNIQNMDDARNEIEQK